MTSYQSLPIYTNQYGRNAIAWTTVHFGNSHSSVGWSSDRLRCCHSWSCGSEIYPALIHSSCKLTTPKTCQRDIPNAHKDWYLGRQKPLLTNKPGLLNRHRSRYHCHMSGARILGDSPTGSTFGHPGDLCMASCSCCPLGCCRGCDWSGKRHGTKSCYGSQYRRTLYLPIRQRPQRSGLVARQIGGESKDERHRLDDNIPELRIS